MCTDKKIPSVLAPNFSLATEAIQERAQRATKAFTCGKVPAELKEFSHDGVAIPILTGVNGSRKQWYRGDWALRIEMRHVGQKELDTVRLIFYPAQVDSFLVQSCTAHRVHLDLHISARVRENE